MISCEIFREFEKNCEDAHLSIDTRSGGKQNNNKHYDTEQGQLLDLVNITCKYFFSVVPDNIICPINKLFYET